MFSLEDATSFVRSIDFDAFIAVGGGSVMDTAKAANLYSCDPEAPLLKYVNAPIGDGTPVTVPLKPFYAGWLLNVQLSGSFSYRLSLLIIFSMC